MSNEKFEILKSRLNIKEDSKLSGYFINETEFVTEVKSLNNSSICFFILAMLNSLIQKKYFNKETIMDMIDKIL